MKRFNFTSLLKNGKKIFSVLLIWILFIINIPNFVRAIDIETLLQEAVNTYTGVIYETLNEYGISSNLSELYTGNIQNFENLYFEMEGFGGIEFNTGLDLTDESTIGFLSGLNEQLSMSGGYIEFDPDSSIFNVPATLSLYLTGEYATGFVEYANNWTGGSYDWIEVVSDSEILSGTQLAEKISNLTGSCNGEYCVVMFDTTGFTSFELDYSVLETESADPLLEAVNTYTGDIYSTLAEYGILNNLFMVNTGNIQNFENLYFEIEGYGEIEFNTGLDLTDENTIDFLTGLNNQLTMSGGYIEFDPGESVFNIPATLSMYLSGEYATGFVEYANNWTGGSYDWIEVVSDSEILTGTELAEKISNLSGSCDEEMCEVSFDTTGFTSFELNYVVLESPDSTYEVSFTVSNDDLSVNDIKLDVINNVGSTQTGSGGIYNLADGTYEYKASMTGYITQKETFVVNGTGATIDLELVETYGEGEITSVCTYPYIEDNEQEYCDKDVFKQSLEISLTGNINGNSLTIANGREDDNYSYKSIFTDSTGSETELFGELYKEKESNNIVMYFYIENYNEWAEPMFLQQTEIENTEINSGTGTLSIIFYYQDDDVVTIDKELFYDDEKPLVSNVSYVDNNDGTYTLTATGTDNYGIENFYWYENDPEYNRCHYLTSNSSSLSTNSINQNSIELESNLVRCSESSFTSGSSITITPDRNTYYVKAYDYVGNYGTGKVEIELQVDSPANLIATGVNQEGFTIEWDEVDGADSYDILLNGELHENVLTGTTSYTFVRLSSSTYYYPSVRTVQGELKSAITEIKVKTLGNELQLELEIDEKCLDSESEYNEWLSVNVYPTNSSNWRDHKYAYKELSSTSMTVVFEGLKSGDYNYNIWAGRCGNFTGDVTISSVTTENVNITAGKWINTIVKENSIDGNTVSSYNIELIPNSSSYNHLQRKYTYVNSITGSLLNLDNNNYLIKVRDGQTWTNKNIVGVYTGENSENQISTTNLLENAKYNSGDTIYIVIQEGHVLAGNANIGNGYISLYTSGTNTYVAGGSIINGQFTLMGIPSGDYQIYAYPYNYKYNKYSEYLSINSNVINKSLTFTQKNLDISGDFSKQFALEGKRLSLKLNPNQNNAGTLSFVSGTDIISSATYKVYSGTDIVLTGTVNISGDTDFTNIAGKTITVDMILKTSIPSELEFLVANFEELELSLPIVRIDYTAPATVLENTNFKITGTAPANASLQALYGGEVIGTGSSNNNGAFEITTKIAESGSGVLLIKDTTNNILSDSSDIEVGSSESTLPILQSYEIKVNDVSRVSSSDGTVKYFSVWAKGNLTSADKVEIITVFTNSPTVKYFVGGIEAVDGIISKGTEIGYGTKDVVVQYVKDGVTYTQTIAKMVILIDPAGYVYNNNTNERVAGLEATLYELVDKNGDRVEDNSGIDEDKIDNYRTSGSGYSKDDIIDEIDVCKGGGDAYPCEWSLYDSTGYGEEPNPQITDSEGKYAWMTPTGFYYVDFKSDNTDKYDDFVSQVVFIPPEVTDLDIGISYKTGYSETENSTNYDRTRTWDGSSWGEWVYTCKNDYTGDNCETAPEDDDESEDNSSSGSSGGGGGGGGSYYNPYTLNSTNDTVNENTPKNEDSGNDDKERDNDDSDSDNEYEYDQKNVNGTDVTIKTPVFKNSKTQEIVNKINELIVLELQKRKISGKDLKSFIENYNKFLEIVKQIKDGHSNKEIRNEGQEYLSNIVAILDAYKEISQSEEIKDEEFELAFAFFNKYGLTDNSNIDEFRPYDNLTRQEAATFFSIFGTEVLGLEETNQTCSFTDISMLDSSTQSDIISVCAMGIMGKNSDKFRPYDTVTRAELFTVLVRAMLGKSLDENIDPWWDNYFKEAQKLGLTKETDTWDQDRKVSRYETALILYRIWLSKESL